MNLVYDCIRFCVLIISLAIWFVVGVAVWIPLLCRSVASFSFAILHSTITGVGVTREAAMLNKAVIFYIDGFTRIVDAIRASASSSDEQSDEQFHFDWLRLAIEIGWAATFWAVIYATLKKALHL
ncbi:hypothetical protein RJ527_13365 [Thalassospiraceae bacterium LMO-SO8]|nr:hypothetical protein [Alphaproteobacteria bacterium LMO-S08]WND75027.1 hypothetical protein RJ527_13365 [Thalassospiraceae bacterium LMO-SO8]